MANFLWVLPAILFAFSFHLSEGLECYHCYTDSGFSYNTYSAKDANFVRCNEANLTMSNTWVCPHPKAQCVYQVVDVQSTHMKQTWRSCSNGITDPCDPNNMPPGIKMTKCLACSTNRCNLYPAEKNDVFTFNINANVNLYIRQ